MAGALGYGADRVHLAGHAAVTVADVRCYKELRGVVTDHQSTKPAAMQNNLRVTSVTRFTAAVNK